MRWTILLAALALAGCAQDPAPLVAGEPRYGDAEVPRFPEARWEWRDLAAGGFALTPAAPHVLRVEVPAKTVAIYANATLREGAAMGYRVELAGCLWSHDGPIVALGQTFRADCVAPAAGATEVRATTAAGALAGDMLVAAVVCVDVPGARTTC